MSDLISRQAAIDAITQYLGRIKGDFEQWEGTARIILDHVPPAQSNLSEAYSKAVFAWLRDYQIRAAELKGRYTPYEVLSWVINDWRKEHGRHDKQRGTH